MATKVRSWKILISEPVVLLYLCCCSIGGGGIDLLSLSLPCAKTLQSPPKKKDDLPSPLIISYYTLAPFVLFHTPAGSDVSLDLVRDLTRGLDVLVFVSIDAGLRRVS